MRSGHSELPGGFRMNPEKAYQYLQDLAEQLGISIRYEDLSDPEVAATSGPCILKGRHFYIMDRSKTPSEKVTLLSQYLCRMDLDGIYVLPAIRQLLEAARRITQPE
jgi:hypothetical protein